MRVGCEGTRRGATSVDDCRLIDLPQIPDPRGNLTFIEGRSTIPFPIERAYWIYDVPGGRSRTGHAYYTLDEFVVALSGSLTVTLEDGVRTRRVVLRRSYVGLHVPPMIWRRFEDFSTNGVCLVLASTGYDEGDYVRDQETFLELKRGGEGR
jgi:hypothetical protein